MKATVQGFGPFDSPAVFELDLEPPVSEIRGYNGAGKSTLLTLIRRALGDDSAIPTRTHGTTGGAEFILEAQGQSLTLRLGKNFTPKSTQALAAFPVQLATKDSSQIEALVGPDDQSESNADAAKARRLIALASIARVEPTPANLRFMASDLEVKLDGWKADNIAAIRLELYSRLTAIAKTYTTQADEHAGRAKGLEAQIAPLPTAPAATTVDAAATAVETARRQLGRLEDSHAARLEMERRIAALAGGLPAPEWPASFAELMETLTRVVCESGPADANLEDVARALGDADAGLRATRAAVATYRAQRAVLDTPITGATAADVEAATKALADAQAELAHAKGYETRQALEAQLTQAREAEGVARAAARKYEAAAKAIPTRMATLIQRSGLTDMSVDDSGDVVVQVGGQWFPYALRSRSERVIAAVRLIASRVVPVAGKLSLIIIPDTLWTALDSSHRETLEIQLEPYAGHVHILTEAPTTEPLEISHPLG